MFSFGLKKALLFGKKMLENAMYGTQQNPLNLLGGEEKKISFLFRRMRASRSLLPKELPRAIWEMNS